MEELVMYWSKVSASVVASVAKLAERREERVLGVESLDRERESSLVIIIEY